jgi:indolepyruvate ferredoxin oxidoreductase beta subunit
MYNILFCGTGGQGILLASELCALAAMNSGYHVKKSEVHGMAQRGGSVDSHVRFGPVVYSPVIMPGEADFLICFHAGEGQRLAHFLRKGGLHFGQFLDEAPKVLPSMRFLNTYLVGILSSRLPIARDHWFEAFDAIVKRAQQENRQVFLQGAERGTKV